MLNLIKQILKRSLTTFFCLIVITLIIICFHDFYLYDPLNKMETEYLFGEKIKLKKTCSKDLIGFSCRGEVLEIYKYGIKNDCRDLPLVANKNYLSNYFKMQDPLFVDWNSSSFESHLISDVSNTILGTEPQSQLVTEFVEKLNDRDCLCCYLCDYDYSYCVFVLDKERGSMYFLKCRI